MNKGWSEQNITMQAQIKKKDTYEAGIGTLFDLRNQLMETLTSLNEELSRDDFEMVSSLSFDELKKKISEERKEYLKSLNVVSDDKNAIWLIDYWCGKDIRGLIQMPFSRHWIMHIEASLNLYNEDGRVIGYKKNIYCFPPMGTPDGGAYTTAEDLNFFLTSIQNKILLDDTHAKMLLTAHCPDTRDKEWWGIPGLYERNGYAFEFLFLPDSEEPFCIYKDGQNDCVAARFNYYPKEDISVTILSNQD